MADRRHHGDEMEAIVTIPLSEFLSTLFTVEGTLVPYLALFDPMNGTDRQRYALDLRTKTPN